MFLTFSDYKHELKATSPQTGGQQSGGSLKSMKDKSGKEEKDAQEGSALKTAGAEGEITAGSENSLSSRIILRLPKCCIAYVFRMIFFLLFYLI